VKIITAIINIGKVKINLKNNFHSFFIINKIKEIDGIIINNVINSVVEIIW
jgi:hypothetical protein